MRQERLGKTNDLFIDLLKNKAEGDLPIAIVNCTNWCNLKCEHCFVYRDSNPNEKTERIRDEPSDDELLAELKSLAEKHGTLAVLWMGGEPMLKKELLIRGTPQYLYNIVTTNGTIPLMPLPNTHYVISVDGPEPMNDSIRGQGVFAKIQKMLSQLPEDFPNSIQAQCVVTRRNQHLLEETVQQLMQSRFHWMTFSFYVPRANDQSPDCWQSLAERQTAVEEVIRLKRKYPQFVLNSSESLELMHPDNAPYVTAHCPAKANILPLYLGSRGFEQTFCCYGNDVNCDLCGAWVVFHFAAKLGFLDQIKSG